MKMMKLTALVSATAAAILAGCGGGGGSTPAPAPATAPAPAPTTSSTTNATPTYAAGSPQLTALTQLNTWRQAYGFPTLTQNTLLDQAAANHLNYMQLNTFFGHLETQGKPGFTGVTPADRSTAVGYGANGGEEITEQPNDIGGAASIAGLASIPYHLAGLFYPFTNFGMAYGQINSGPSYSYYDAELTFGNPAAPPAYSNAPLTFPCQGVTGVDYENAGAETPIPTINGSAVQFPIGTPVTVIGNVADVLRLSSGQMVNPQGTAIPLTLMDSSNDSQAELQPFMAVAFPATPLAPNTTYSVSLSGTVNGTLFTRSFSFTTGA